MRVSTFLGIARFKMRKSGSFPVSKRILYPSPAKLFKKGKEISAYARDSFNR